jgi:hypothetical protein
MATVLNKETGQLIFSAHTPNHIGPEWIINPSDEEIELYERKPLPIDQEAINIEIMIQEKIRDLGEQALLADNKLKKVDGELKIVKENL